MLSLLEQIEESTGKAELTKTHTQLQQTPYGPIQHHRFSLYHPNLRRNITIHATVTPTDKNYASIDVVGDHSEYNKVGAPEVRRIARQIGNEIGVTHVGGIRVGGARKNIKDPLNAYTRIKLRESEEDIYDTQDLEEFSQHLMEKHGAHVDLYRTPEGHVNLQTLIVPKKLRGRGIASAVVTDIKKYSNRNKVKIILNAVPLDKSTSNKKLIGFYKKHGFVENKGRNKNYSLGLNTMYRNSNQKEPQHATA